MSPRSLILAGCGLVALMGCLVLALVVHAGKESSANPPPAPASSVTPLDALAHGLGTPGAGSPTGRLAAKLSVERQVAQLFFVGFDGFTTAPALKREWGAVLVRPSNTADAAQVKRLTYRLGTPRKKGRVPALVTAAEPATGDGFPGAQARKQPALARGGSAVVEREAQRTARRLRSLGFRMALTPIADVATEGGFRADSAYGFRPSFVAVATRAAVQGYLAGGVAPAPGHFPGDGGVASDPDSEPAPVGLTLPDLRVRDLVPFRAVTPIAPAIQMTNAVYVAYDGVTPATLLPEAVGLLRDELKYGGAIVSADLAASGFAYPISVPAAAVEALKAGCDLLLVKGTAKDQERAYRAVLGAVRRGEISRLALTAAVRRVLALKIKAGVIRPDGTPVALPKPPKPKPKPKPAPLPATTVP
jgi:beta-N-acetylhexosaminidase